MGGGGGAGTQSRKWYIYLGILRRGDYEPTTKKAAFNHG